jgi:hypothetical protein
MDDQSSKVLGVMKERDFYHAKVEELQKRIKVLEFDNAELVKRDDELSLRCKELASKTNFRKPQRRFNRG